MTSMAASQPDIEDLIKIDVAADSGILYSTQHDASKHNFYPEKLSFIQMKLLEWYDAHRRKLPWRGDLPPYLTTATHMSQKMKRQVAANTGVYECAKKDEMDDTMTEEVAIVDCLMKSRDVSPYETWVSEIMLQQTRVDTVVEYFLRWIDKFPTIASLAEAKEEDVNSLWAGLGYYRRARMLHAGAKHVVENFGGVLPSSVKELLTIPGVGPYTAGAIASIAFGKREPLVDGNVIRVIARMLAVGADPKNKQLVNHSWKSANELVSECDHPGILNQALMELGATICTIQNPQCSYCPVKSTCLAYEEAQKVTVKNRLAFGSSAASCNSCSICDYTRVTEWDETHTEVRVEVRFIEIFDGCSIHRSPSIH